MRILFLSHEDASDRFAGGIGSSVVGIAAALGRPKRSAG